VLRDLVLVGGGHAHVGVVRRFAMHPEPGVRLTLISRQSVTPYSGMLPGYIAGHYRWDEVHIDLDRLCRFAQATLIRAEVIGIDRDHRRVLLADRPPVAFDLLSLNLGSTPRNDSVPGAAEYAVAVKPIDGFNTRWTALYDRLAAQPGRASIAIVGAGAAGVEIAFALQHRLDAHLQRLGRPQDAPQLVLYGASPRILPTHADAVRRRVLKALAARNIELRLGAPVVSVEAGALQWRGARHVHDEIIWVTQAGGAPWLRGTGLALDESGFIEVDATLRTQSDPRIFAAGDVAAFPGHALEKAGVFAVRMGRPLADNLRRALRGEPLQPYHPQRHWLALLATGDRHAIASRGPFGFEGDWVWRWKDWIDRRFMRRFSEIPARTQRMLTPAGPTVAHRLALDPGEAQQALSVLAMRCGGCGAKVGADVLSRVLARLDPGAHPDVMIGLDAPDDAAVIAVPPGRALVQSVDFFRSFIDDPWIFGRIAATHALSDLFAMGAQPHSALALVTVPAGLDAKIEELLVQLMSGALQVLREAGCVLAGGHTAEAQELAMGFSVNGWVDASLSGLTRKVGLQPGDKLVLTKPLGTGTVLVAREALAAQAGWVDAAIASMLRSNQAAGQCLRAHGAPACTDVTGFGLLGHLSEMTRASGVGARLVLNAIPALPGALESLANGHFSSLQAGNQKIAALISSSDRSTTDPRIQLLFDPQTSGGLIAGVPPERVDSCLEALRAQGDADAAVVGEVLELVEGELPFILA
jgi:selenide,water dikinase